MIPSITGEGDCGPVGSGRVHGSCPPPRVAPPQSLVKFAATIFTGVKRFAVWQCGAIPPNGGKQSANRLLRFRDRHENHKQLGDWSCRPLRFSQSLRLDQHVGREPNATSLSRPQHFAPPCRRNAALAAPLAGEVHGNTHVTAELCRAGPLRNEVLEGHVLQSSRTVYKLQDTSWVVCRV